MKVGWCQSISYLQLEQVSNHDMVLINTTSSQNGARKMSVEVSQMEGKRKTIHSDPCSPFLEKPPFQNLSFASSSFSLSTHDLRIFPAFFPSLLSSLPTFPARKDNHREDHFL